MDFGGRYSRLFRCARLSPALPAGAIPAPARGQPPHREPSLGRMEVTTWAKRRQGDTRAVTPVKPNEPRDKDRMPTRSNTWKARGRRPLLGKATGSPAGSKGTARVATEASEEPGRSIAVLGQDRVCQLNGPSRGRQTRQWKSDPLIVLRARESRVHGEAREQDTWLQWGHISYTQRQDPDVNSTTEDRSTSEAGPAKPASRPWRTC